MCRVLASNANSTIIFSAILALLFQILSISEAEDPSIYSCYNSGNYTSGSQFETNLNQTFSSLYSNTPLTRFNTTVSGNVPNRVYGLVQCRGDSTEDECRNCVNTSATEILLRCPNRKEGSIRYWGCVLRFADSDFFGQIDGQSPKIYYFPVDNVTDVTLFNERVAGLMDHLSTTAAESPSKFATGRNSSVNNFQFVYGMLQCTSDLSNNDCYTCLQNIISDIPSCCNWRSGGNVYTVSCFLRYDSYSFFNLLSPPPPSSIQVSPPALSPPPPAVDGGGTNTTLGIGKSSSTIVISTVVPAVTAVILVSVAYVCCCKRRKLKSGGDGELNRGGDGPGEVSMVQSFQFDFETIRAATADFSDLNKLGQGGFGPVYKGKLLNGQEIAVKRLSGNSGQGEQEFKNEVVLVAKLQHRNLARLLGFSLQGKEKLLIYEFLPNTSLDHFIFDPIKCTLLNWEKRYKIICGIARGLLYLHEDSQLRIIHRDLKASNVLLDEEMNPKISDFGMARLFVIDQTQNTNRIVGTYGYMAPEYALHGFFSVKSDVYSFGVLLLEIVSGRKNNSFSQDHNEDLLCYAWRHWKENMALEFIDPTLRGNCSIREVMQCIHIGLLCVQEDVADRPTMASVNLMFSSSSLTLQIPSSPAFFGFNRNDLEKSSSRNYSSSSSTSKPKPISVNGASITELHPR